MTDTTPTIPAADLATPIVANVLLTQPGRRPSRKIAGVAGAAVLGTILTGAIASALPDLSVACGEELGGVLAPMIGAAATGALATLTDYLRHERA